MRARLPQFELRITNHGRSGSPSCGGTPPATPPSSYATEPARPQPIARPTSPHPPLQFLATGHWQLTTGNYPLSTAVPQSRPALPCKRLRNVLYCEVGPEHNHAGPKSAASHNCPPTMPRPPAMPTRSVPNIRILPPANIAPGAAGTNRKCTALPSAAPPTRSGTGPAIQPMPAPPPPGSVSCHKEHAAVTVLRIFFTKTTSSAYFRSKNDREPTAAASCYESPCQYPVTRREKHFSNFGPNWAKQRIRYPIDTLSIPVFRRIRSHSSSQLDTLRPLADRIGLPQDERRLTSKSRLDRL